MVHLVYDVGIFKPISTLYMHKIRKIDTQDNSRKRDGYGPVDPETRLHGRGTGWTAEIEQRHG